LLKLPRSARESLFPTVSLRPAPKKQNGGHAGRLEVRFVSLNPQRDASIVESL
jgi:hypothetical protein